MRRRLLGILLTGVMAFSLVGCAGESDSSVTTTSETTKKETTKKETTSEKENNEDISANITFWAFPNFANGDNPGGTYEQEVIDAFNEKYPNIKVKLEMLDYTSGPEKITAAIEGGTICDVLFDAPGRIISYGKAGVLADLDDMFTDEFIEDVNNEAIINSCKGDSTYYMYPLSTAPFLMAFDKGKLEEAGCLDLLNLEDDRNWSTDDFKELLEKMTDAGYQGGSVFCSGQGGDQGTRAFVSNLYSSSITNSDITEYTINDENGVKSLEFINEAIDNNWMMNGSAYNGGQDIELFATGQTYFTILWSAGLQGQQQNNLDASGVEPIAVPFPSDDSEPELEYLVDGFCVFDNKDDDRIEASKLFIDFVCNDEEWGPKDVVQTSTFPVRESFGNLYEDDEMMTYLSGLVKYYSPYYNTIDGFAEMRTYWFPMLQSIINKEATPQEAADKFVENANKSIKNAE